MVYLMPILVYSTYPSMNDQWMNDHVRAFQAWFIWKLQSMVEPTLVTQEKEWAHLTYWETKVNTGRFRFVRMFTLDLIYARSSPENDGWLSDMSKWTWDVCALKFTKVRDQRIILTTHVRNAKTHFLGDLNNNIFYLAFALINYTAHIDALS